ncbi:MAG: right-handed parallel beta-helix repeat-containing protein [Thermogutta sp.]
MSDARRMRFPSGVSPTNNSLLAVLALGKAIIVLSSIILSRWVCGRYLLQKTSAAEVVRFAERQVITIRNDNQLRQVLRAVQPGVTIRIQAGQYPGNVYLENLHGAANAPIIIEGVDPQNPPVFVGGETGWQISEGSHFVLRYLRFRGQKVNGLNIDDGGSFETPTHHIRLENIVVEDVGPKGNFDGIKLSGVTDFVVRHCRVEGWGGQAIDMVGCHRGLIEQCTFRGKEGFSQDTGPQAKGGSSQITIRHCLFLDAAQRSVQLGGSTGLAFFRPRGVLYEAKDLLVENCVFVGGEAAVSFVGVDGAIFRQNTVIRPKLWVLRILQETREPGFVPSRNGVFERNLIVFRSDLRDFVNVGPATAPETFRFADNWWYCEDRPQASRPRLPVEETGGIYGQDPQLRQTPAGWWEAQNPAARRYGAGSQALSGG